MRCINSDDIILGINVDSSDSKIDFEARLNWLQTDVINYFKDTLFQKFKIKNIRRIGIVFTHEIQKNEKLSEAIKLLTESKVTDANNISVTFAKKSLLIYTSHIMK